MNWKRGLALALGTCVLWGTQSIAMKLVVQEIPSDAVAFAKLFVSTFFLGVYLSLRKEVPSYLTIRSTFLPVILSGVALSVSYKTFAWSFRYLTPANVQLYMQTERILLAMVGIFIFREMFRRSQWLGLILLPLGYFLFFRDQLWQETNPFEYLKGVSLVITAAFTWVIYAFWQKRLLTHLSPSQSLFLIFTVASVILLPQAELGSFTKTGVFDRALLLLICLSSGFAFLCFSKGMTYWELSRISVVISLTPLFTFALMFICTRALEIERLEPEHLSFRGSLGAVLIMLGSALAARPIAALKNYPEG